MKRSTGKIAIIGGARPNFMKIAPLVRALLEKQMPHVLISTGQHFDKQMAGQFFLEFGLKPDYTLRPSRTSPMRQMSDIMLGLEKVFEKEKPKLVVVVGDVNSTLYGALVARSMKIPVAHIEAGLRSNNKDMPEETNRVLVDHISDILFTTDEDGKKNLRNESVTGAVHFAGNIMIDTLRLFENSIRNSDERFFFATMHRAENVDNKERFKSMLLALEIISHDAPIYMPLHPRTKKMAETFGVTNQLKRVFKLLPPLSYSETLYYEKNAILVLTDSGGIQEETSYLGTPCLTLRTETERPVTLTHGTNVMAGVTKASILKAYKQTNLRKRSAKIPYWDGRSSERIVKVLSKFLQGKSY